MSQKHRIILAHVLIFLTMWYCYIDGIVSKRPEFIEEYGWLAYQPFSFFPMVCFSLAETFIRLGPKWEKQGLNWIELRIKAAFLVIAYMFVVSIVALFYVHVLGRKPNLLICL